MIAFGVGFDPSTFVMGVYLGPVSIYVGDWYE